MSEKQESKLARVIVTILWLVLSVGVDIVAITTQGYLVGAIIEFVFFIVTFCVPFLRKKGSYTRWFGWLAFLQGTWLIYLQFAG